MLERIDYVEIAERYIKQLVTEFENNPYNFFSESDVKCRLFMMLYQDSVISELKQTTDGKWISPLHSEVSYFNEKGKLVFHVDLSAIDPETTDVYSTPRTEGIRFAKGYRAGECSLAIEIKLNKVSNKRRMLTAWEKDMKKLEGIKSRNPHLTCFSILLDKKNQISSNSELVHFQRVYPNVKIVYASANGYECFMNFCPQSS